MLYHGARTWQVPRNFSDLLDLETGLETPVRKMVERYLSAFEYLLASPGQIEDVLKEHVMSEPVEKAFISTADQLRQQGFVEGYDTGYDAGQTAKSRAMLRKQLARRFGPLSAEVDARIEQAAQAQLDRWIEEIVVASSLDEVFRA